MLIYELLTHHMPFRGYQPIQGAVAVALENKRPKLPLGLPDAVFDIIASGWSTQRNMRPRAKAMLDQIAALPKILTPAEMDWLDEPKGHPVGVDAHAVPE